MRDRVDEQREEDRLEEDRLEEADGAYKRELQGNCALCGEPMDTWGRYALGSAYCKKCRDFAAKVRRNFGKGGER